MPDQKHVGAVEASTPMSPDKRLEARRQLFAAYGAAFPAAMERKPARRLAFRDVGVARFVAGIASAGLGSSVVAIDGLYTEPHPRMIWPVSVCVMGSEILWLIPGAVCLMALWQLRGFIRRAECLTIGAVLGCFQLPVAVQIARLLAPLAAIFHHTPGHIHDLGPVDLSVADYLWAAIVFAPPGALGGWLLWKVLCPRSDEAEGLSQLARYANPITGRLMLGLAIIPLIPAFVLTIFLTAVVPGEKSSPLVLAWTVGDGELFSVIAGAALAMLIAIRRPIRRAECLWIGMGITLLLPLVVYFAGSALRHFGADIESNPSGGLGAVADIASILMLGYLLMLAGLPGGWLLWRIAFKNRQPAPAPLSSIFE